MSIGIMVGDCRSTLRRLPDRTFDCCVTSPPYYGLRDYGSAVQIGHEQTPEEYVEVLVGVMREVRRTLRDDGTLWLNLGDSYAKGRSGGDPKQPHVRTFASNGTGPTRQPSPGVHRKQLLGIPWRVAFAMQDDGWILRSEIVWAKASCMPESVKDRPTCAHEKIFLFAKQGDYYYDHEAVREPAAQKPQRRSVGLPVRMVPGQPRHAFASIVTRDEPAIESADGRRNLRNVWTLPTQPFPGAHFAVMPPALAERCILAGSRPGGHVLDPFAGAGTTGLAADRLGRSATLLEANDDYAMLSLDRLMKDAQTRRRVAERASAREARRVVRHLAATRQGILPLDHGASACG